MALGLGAKVCCRPNPNLDIPDITLALRRQRGTDQRWPRAGAAADRVRAGTGWGAHQDLACRGVMLGTDCLARTRRAPPRLVPAPQGRGSAGQRSWTSPRPSARLRSGGERRTTDLGQPRPGSAGCGPAGRRVVKCPGITPCGQRHDSARNRSSLLRPGRLVGLWAAAGPEGFPCPRITVVDP